MHYAVDLYIVMIVIIWDYLHQGNMIKKMNMWKSAL
jgi:hypothetical protein